MKHSPQQYNSKKNHFLYKLPGGELHSVESLAPEKGLASKERCTGKEMIWGSLLGDAYCNFRGCITLEHSVQSTPYVFWKWQLLGRENMLTQTSLPRLVHRQDRRNGRHTHSLRFNTRTLFQEERALFYPLVKNRAVKSVPPLSTMCCRLTPAALAVWYMDDGGPGGKSKRGCVIDVSCWGERGGNQIQVALETIFQLETSFHGRHGGSGVKLFIPERSVGRFKELITPYIIPSMYYKIAHLF